MARGCHPETRGTCTGARVCRKRRRGGARPRQHRFAASLRRPGEARRRCAGARVISSRRTQSRVRLSWRSACRRCRAWRIPGAGGTGGALAGMGSEAHGNLLPFASSTPPTWSRSRSRPRPRCRTRPVCVLRALEAHRLAPLVDGVVALRHRHRARRHPRLEEHVARARLLVWYGPRAAVDGARQPRGG